MKRIVALVIILFFIPTGRAGAQCTHDSIVSRPFVTENINNGIGHYFQNLIIQDIALSSQQAFKDISLHFNYRFRFTADLCSPGLVEIQVYPVYFICSPLLYQGYDISSSIHPDIANITFHLIQPGGFITDSLVFRNVPVESDSSLYTSMHFLTGDSSASFNVAFARSDFYYTRDSYERFRDPLLQIDRYYAASAIADSAVGWVDDGFLSEKGTSRELMLRQLELDRLTRAVDPVHFPLVLNNSGPDLAGLSSKYKDLLKMNSRFKAIIRFKLLEYEYKENEVSDDEFVESFLDGFDRYYKLAYQSDFRYLNFFEEISVPSFTNASLLVFYRLLNTEYGMPASRLGHWEFLLENALIKRGGEYESGANQSRALTYYHAAANLATLLNLDSLGSKAVRQEGRMQDSISVSYLAISRKSALTDNPVFAARYFHKAQDIYKGKLADPAGPKWLKDYRDWLYGYFENQAVRYMELKNYQKAFVYLTEIENQCLADPDYPCPESFYAQMSAVREGFYLELLGKSNALFTDARLQEAGEKYNEAISLRLGSGYRIEKNILESDLERKFHQISYDDYIEKGIAFINMGEFNSALYYFNKAAYIERAGVLHQDPVLIDYRQNTARKVILLNLSEGRVRAWAHDFAGAEAVVKETDAMLSEYQLGPNDSLAMQNQALRENIRQARCQKAQEEYDLVMLSADNAEKAGDYIMARESAGKGIEIASENQQCGLNDQDAWYKQVLWEIPAEYQQLERSLDRIAAGDFKPYIDQFGELKKFYDDNHIEDFGIDFTPLYDRAKMSGDSTFLAGMFRYYFNLNEYEHAVVFLDRMRETGIPAGTLKFEQEMVAEYLAVRDVKNPEISKPWDQMRSYTGHNHWFRAFNWKYKMTWLKSAKWKLRYWPLIWK